jgi:hypothetical protein
VGGGATEEVGHVNEENESAAGEGRRAKWRWEMQEKASRRRDSGGKGVPSVETWQGGGGAKERVEAGRRDRMNENGGGGAGVRWEGGRFL